MYAVWIFTLLLAAAAILAVQAYLRAKGSPLSLRQMATLLAVPTIGVLSAIPLKDSGIRFEVSLSSLMWIVLILWPYLLCLLASFRIESRGAVGRRTVWAYASMSFVTLATGAWAASLSFAS
jgi:hypothetical protein